jgi:hypothetical protein
MSSREQLCNRLLAERLQRSVVFIVLTKLVNAVLRIESSEGAVLAQRAGSVGIDRDARNEYVMADGVCQHLCGGMDDARHVTGGIDDPVPLPSSQDIEFAFTVATELLGLRKQIWIRAPAVEQRDVMPTRESAADDSAAEKLRPAENKQSHRAASMASP